jgi:nicotinate-nucleotide adenylyltransferase
MSARRGAAKTSQRVKRVALFGGSFDPVHLAHLAVAEAAMKQFHLDRIIFVPSGNPPHKTRHLVPYPHRFAMVALACAHDSRLLVSTAEAGPDQLGRGVIYSVDTVRRFRKIYRGPGVKLFFILGADQFLGIGTWKNCETLLGLCDFIVANRPGFELEKLRGAIPRRMLAPASKNDSRTLESGAITQIALRSTAVYPLASVAKNISATDIRRRLARHQTIRGLVPRAVEEYIRKQGLYQ